MLKSRTRGVLLISLVLVAALTPLGLQGAGQSAGLDRFVGDFEVGAPKQQFGGLQHEDRFRGGARTSETSIGTRDRRHFHAVGRQVAGSDLPTHSITLPSGATAFWLAHGSPTTQVLGDARTRDKHRIIRWGPGGLYADTRRTYAVFGFRLVTGSPGRMYDFHTQPNDVGGWTPPCSNGVAPLAIDYAGNSGGLRIQAQPEDDGCDGGGGKFSFPIFTQAEMEKRQGRWVWLWAEITWGRRELVTKGALKVWVAGEDTPRVNVSGINTHYRGQNQITFWEGVYHGRGSPGTSGIEIAATRFGRTPEEAHGDIPELYRAESAGSPGGAAAVVAPRLSTEAVFLRVLTGRVQTDKRCRVWSTKGRVIARIADARDDRDTAIVTYPFRQRYVTVVSYRLRVVARRLAGPLIVTRLQAHGQVLAELYVSTGGTLRLSSPPGTLRPRGFDIETGLAARPGAADARAVELRLTSSSALLVVDGREVVRVARLDGPPRDTPLTARIGIHRYDSRAGGGAIHAVFDELVVGAS